jgi:hypothetical protein
MEEPHILYSRCIERSGQSNAEMETSELTSRGDPRYKVPAHV